MKKKKLKKIYVIVDQDKELINKLCRIAIQSGWVFNELFHDNSNSSGELTNAKLEALIEDLGSYKAQTLGFVINSDREILEVNFIRLLVTQCDQSLSRIDDGHDKTQLQLAIDWIKAQKGTFSSN
jgi:hypothetical protein